MFEMVHFLQILMIYIQIHLTQTRYLVPGDRYPYRARSSRFCIIQSFQ